jgi:hypothetical protein
VKFGGNVLHPGTPARKLSLDGSAHTFRKSTRNPHIPIASSQVSHHSSLVIPTAVEGSAVGSTATDLQDERSLPLCYLDQTTCR